MSCKSCIWVCICVVFFSLFLVSGYTAYFCATILKPPLSPKIHTYNIIGIYPGIHCFINQANANCALPFSWYHYFIIKNANHNDQFKNILRRSSRQHLKRKTSFWIFNYIGNNLLFISSINTISKWSIMFIFKLWQSLTHYVVSSSLICHKREPLSKCIHHKYMYIYITDGVLVCVQCDNWPQDYQ